MGEQHQESSLNTEPVQGESVLGVLWGGEAPVGRTSTSCAYQGVFPSHLMDYIWLSFSQNSLKGWLIILNHHLDQYSQLSHFIFFCKEKKMSQDVLAIRHFCGGCSETVLRHFWRPISEIANTCFQECAGDSRFPGSGVDSVQGRLRAEPSWSPISESKV